MKTVKNIQVTRLQKNSFLISKNKIKGKSKCAICLTEITFIHEIEDKDELEIYLQCFTDWCYKTKHENLLREV